MGHSCGLCYSTGATPPHFVIVIVIVIVIFIFIVIVIFIVIPSQPFGEESACCRQWNSPSGNRAFSLLRFDDSWKIGKSGVGRKFLNRYV